MKKKKTILLVCGKMLAIQFPYKKNANHRPFIHISLIMELHKKCMRSIFHI